MPQKLKWNVVRRAHHQRLFHEDDVDSKNYKGGLSTRKRQGKETEEETQLLPVSDEYESDFSSSEEEVPVGQQPSIKIRAPIHKDKALAAVQKCKVLRGLSIRGQVRIANMLQYVTYNSGTELWSAQDAHEKRFVLIESGEVENWLPASSDSAEQFVGRSGPGSVLGGLFAVGSFSHPVFTVRVASNDEQKPLQAWEINSTNHVHFSTSFHAEEMHVLRRRVLQDLRLQLLPFLQRWLAGRGFFSRYSGALISRLVKDMDLRLFEPGQVIFKERAPGRSMGLIVRGSVEISANGRRVMSKGPGQEIGEAALLETGYRRHATTRCSEKSESLLFMVSRDAFHACFEKFPDEKMKLVQQIRHRIAMTALKETFAGCSQEFVHLLSTECDILHLAWPKTACSPTDTDEAMHLFYSGELTVDSESEFEQTTRFARKWEIFGLEAALGLRQGPPKYSLTAGRAGCTLVRMTRASVEKVLHFFPTELKQVLHAAGLSDVPESHAFLAKKDMIWNTVQPLLCQMLCNTDLDLEFCQALAPHFTAAVYDAGCLIASQGWASKEAILVLGGDVRWSQENMASGICCAPTYFDVACMFGEGVHAASLTAQTTTIVWRLGLQSSSGCLEDGHLGKLASEVRRVQDLQQQIQDSLRTSLRNMRTWRRFRSEVIEILCDNLNLRTFLPGQKILEEGDLGESIFIVARGQVAVRTQGKPSILQEGATFGEMVLFGQAHRNISAEAVTLCILNAVHKDLVGYALKQTPRDAVVPEILPAKKKYERRRDAGGEHLHSAKHVEDTSQAEASSREQVATPTPKKLRQRLDQSWLVQMPSPRLPPVDIGLYRTPTTMNAKMQGAFKGIMPPTAIMAASHMHGVREAYHHKCPRKRYTIGFDELPPLTPGRKRATAAYTDRLQRLQPSSPRRKACDLPAGGWQDSQKGFAVVSHLQTLAVSLSRLNSKPNTCRILQNGMNEQHHELDPTLRAPPEQMFTYAKQLERSALAYGINSKPRDQPGGDLGRDSPTAILDYLSDGSDISELSESDLRPRQSEDKPVPLIYLVRRKIYETVAEGQSLGCPVSILLEGAPRERSGLDVDGQLLQMELHIDLAASSADTVAASLRSSPEVGSLGSSESMAVVDLLQDSPGSTRLHSAEAQHLVLQVMESLD